MSNTPVSHDHGDNHGHGTRRGYLTGFVLAVVLTALPFWLVMGCVLGDANAPGLINASLALLQIVVHVRYFLHLDTRSQGGWTLIAFAFTAVVLVIMISGSIWIMYHLNSNMMPGMPAMNGG